MRRLKLLALALVIGTASLFAAGGDDSKEASKKIRNQIVNLLKAPNFIVENEISIKLTFTFSSAGEVVVLKVNSKDRDVLNYIRKNLNYKKVPNPGVRGKIYTMPLKVTAS